jgi:AcrR family transcriptional regulator
MNEAIATRYDPIVADRRDELLDGATAWAFEHGLAQLSLRPLAKALGTSDRMLIYYFGSRDQLLVDIAERATALLVATMPIVDPTHPPRSARVWLDACWLLFTDPGMRPAMSFLFELDALGTRAPGSLRDAARLVADAWIAAVDATLAALGVPSRSRAGLTRVVAAALVGLALDALVAPEPVRPAAAVTVLARVIDAERPG